MKPDSRAAAGRRLYAGMIVLAGAVLAVDQASKAWAVGALSDGGRIALVPGLIELRLLYNPGAAFSIGTDATWVFALAAAVAVVAVLYVGWRLRSAGWMVGLGGILGGAASHLLDRLARAPGLGRGHVVDFIDYGGLFVGNVADIALTACCALLVLLSARNVPLGDPVEEHGGWRGRPAR